MTTNETTTETNATAQPVGGTYQLDLTHTRLGFVARHAMVSKVRGSFTQFEGGITLDADRPTNSSARVTVAMASIDTGQAQRDEHLRTNDFFDVPSHPEMTFVSTAVEPAGKGSYRLIGDLTIKGTTRQVSIDVEYTGSSTDPFGNARVGFEASTTIKRSEWGITYNAALETGGLLVSDKITIELDVSAVKAD